MHGNIDLPRQQRVFNLAGEQALAADLFQRAVQHSVAGGLDHHDFESIGLKTMRGHQPVARLMCLGQRKRRASGADTDGVLGVGHLGHDTGLSAPPRP